VRPAATRGPLSHLSLFGILTGDPRNPFLVSHLLVRFPHRKHVHDLCASRTHPRLFSQGVKKTAQLGTGPREPKSDAKLQPLSDMAKYFARKIEKKLDFSHIFTLNPVFCPFLPQKNGFRSTFSPIILTLCR
jgi:hypothetical protein